MQNINFKGRVGEYLKQTNKDLQELVRLVELSDELSSTLQAYDLVVYKSVVKVLRDKSHEIVDRLGIGAFG